MVEHIQIDFQAIRQFDGDKRKGFEELVCQLARREEIPDAVEFRRIEGAGGDGGLEGYWLLEDKAEYGYQAKYFLATKDIDWSQIDNSVKTALEQHPRLTKYTIAIACDLTDRSGSFGKGKTGWEHWEAHKIKWKKWADGKGMNVEFYPWPKSNLIDKLISDTSNRGLILFWFNANLFDVDWFKNLFTRVTYDLGERFQPEDHVEVVLTRAFDGLARSTAYLDFLSNWFNIVKLSEKFQSAISKLDSILDKKIIQNFEAHCVELISIGQTIYSYNSKPFPITEWQCAIRKASDSIRPILDCLYNLDTNEKDSFIRWDIQVARNCLHEIDTYLDHTPIHIGANNPHEIRIEADLNRLLIVLGDAGSGKSHLFADIVASSIDNGIPSVLLLGQYFQGQDIRREFLNILDLGKYSFEEVLQALNLAGEITQTRMLILIDALNEASDLRVWPYQLAGFVSDILRYDWLAIGVSLRPEYEDVLMPDTIGEKSAHAICHGIQTQEEQEKASVQYFEKRGITRLAVPWLAPEFSNFLFLKTCCDALQELGIKEFPRGLRGSLKVLEFYLDSINKKIRRRFPDIRIPKKAISNSILRIARLMAEKRINFISSKSATAICEEEFECQGPDARTTWVNILASEGLLREDHIFQDDKEDPFATMEKVYRFTYQRFSDHLIVAAYLEKLDNIDDAFQKNGPLHFIVEKYEFWNWNSLWSAFAVQIPEKYTGKEFPDILPKELDSNINDYWVLEAFKQSLLWRSNTAFSERTLELFNTLPIYGSDPCLEIIIRLATLRDHPWNADFLDNTLQNRSLPERDEFWTVQLNDITDDYQHPLWELIRWSLTAKLKSAETETLRLAAITLSWVFTSSSCPLRDTATKALIAIFITRPKLIPVILDQFQDVDDLYVMERICAAILGAIVRYEDHGDINLSAKAIYQAVFDRETPHLNINLRDYACAIIEYAYQKDCIDESIDIKKWRPPYNSSWPLQDVTEQEVDDIAEKAGGNQILHSALKSLGDFGIYEIVPKMHHFTDVPLDKPRPLNNEEKKIAYKRQIKSWDSRKQEALLDLEIAIESRKASIQFETGDKDKFSFGFSYSEESTVLVKQLEKNLIKMLDADELNTFNQLILPSLFPDRIPYEERDLSNFDSNFARRWITKRAYEYGWNRDLFPEDHGRPGYSRERPRIERIGKKYQWLALFEFMARLTDNVWVIGGWPERSMIYDHPATDWFLRDVEPSLLIDPDPPREEKCWWQVFSLDLSPIADECLPMWPFEEEPPYSSEWMEIFAPDGSSWLLLYGFFDNRDARDSRDSIDISYRRSIFVRVSTILVGRDDIEHVVTKLKDCRLSDPSGHETIDWTDGPFLCEYPWRNTWQADYGIYEYGDIGNLSGIKYIRPVARHVWESHLDLSLKNGSSLRVPNPWVSKKLGLKPNLDKIGEFITESDEQPFFIDPSYGTNHSSVALVNKAKFIDFLEKENLECLWIVAGEKNAYPSGHYGDFSCRSFVSVYRWNENRWVGERWYKDKSRD